MSEEKKIVNEDDFIEPAHAEPHEQNIPLLPENLMADILERLINCEKDFTDITDSNLTLRQRRRKVGPGTRNYGFIDKVSDLAESNAKYAAFFKISDLKNCIRNVETCRNIYARLLSFACGQ